LTVCLFFSVSKLLLDGVVRRPNLARRRVTTMSRTYVGFYVYKGRRYENNDIFLRTTLLALEFSHVQSSHYIKL